MAIIVILLFLVLPFLVLFPATRYLTQYPSGDNLFLGIPFLIKASIAAFARSLESLRLEDGSPGLSKLSKSRI